MKHFLQRSAVFVFVLFLSYRVMAQTAVTGKILGENNQPLENATVQLKGSKKVVLSATDGSFQLEGGSKEKKILVSFTGYETQEIPVPSNGIISITLKRDNRQLEEVIITGYSTQSRKFIAGSIVSVNASSIKDIPAAGFNQLLQGKAAGVQVTSNSGVPGGGITFRVRGNNSINASVDPLYVIDGVFVSSSDPVQTSMGNQQQSNPLADINPNDIESIQILKDANATAIYGSLGANGVILVTTKRGRLNSSAKININAYHGWSNAPKKFQVTNGPETALLANEAAYNTAIDNGQDPSAIVLPFPKADTLPTYDRINDLFRTGNTSNYELSAQGGSEKSTYYVGLGYLKQQSIVKPSNFERYSARLNYDTYLSRRLKVGTSINITRTWRNVSSNDNNPQGVINSALFVRSYLPVYNPNGSYAKYGSFDNHLALINNLNNNAVGWRSIGNIYGEYVILPELKFRTSWSVDRTDEYENNYANTLISAGVATNGSAASYQTKNQVLTNEQVLTYIKSFGSGRKHAINALIGNTLNSVLTEGTTATGTGFPSNNFTAISSAATRSGSSSRSEAKLVSFFGKASYTFDNKYTIDGSLRADGSSKFGVNNRWGYFPSGGLTWRASQEEFVKNLNWFDELKFRGSIGLSGNQNGIGAYAAQGLWSAGANYLDNPGDAPTQLANPDLTWETTRQADVGVEFAILNNKLNVIVDYYNKYTYDLLLNVPVPLRSGFASYLQNYGAVRNKGVEITLHSDNINTKEFRWTTDFNIAFNNNKIEKLASDIALGASGRNISILRQGYSVNSFQLYKQLYVDPETGNAVYDDVDKSGTITSADRQIVGNALPRYTGGLTNNLSYKNFDLGFFFYFQQGNKIMNMNDFFLVHGGTQRNIGFVPRQLERWQHPGDITDIPRMTTYSGDPTINGGSANNYGGSVASLSSRYLEDGSFIRLRTITLSYSLPSSVLRNVKLTNLRVYVQASNLFTITKYKGLDPEVSSQSANQNTAGYDWATVPQPRTIQAGINLSF
ncbi:TonB-dependent receptor [Danxiaibacter flavus]|uniref:TonB-dependent receptor n=1 Tax=Danxiaibacter flavus TaxID=3049108 RepID=A0ABV3ZJU0_9BACT|nr:TonB-dependent receptor [Chitinophagaceae bacterium DXS]